jgi:hypothetical protein
MQRLTGALMVVVAGVMFVLALQTLPARLMALSGDGLREAVSGGQNTNEDDFNSFVRSRQRALRWHRTADYLGELATAYTTRGASGGLSDTDADRFFKISADYQIEALSLKAADTYGWSQLAFLEGLQPDAIRKSAAALHMSIETAPYEPDLMASRLDMMLALHDAIDSADQKQITDVARQAWDLDPQIVAANAYRHNYIGVVDAALADDQEATDKFHALLPTPESVPLQ